MTKDKYDFCGYATKNDIRCADGRIIRKNAFADCDGITVPLVWRHNHDALEAVLGHALLENREDGVYTYGCFNDTDKGQYAKKLVAHGDIRSLSIYANKLRQMGDEVIHGAIREVSLVLAGANPGAYIENVTLAHSDGFTEILEEDAIIWMNEPIAHSDESNSSDSAEEPEVIEQEDPELIEEVPEDTEKEEPEEDMADSKPKDESLEHEDGESGKTIGAILETMNDEQREAVEALLGLVVEKYSNGETEHSYEEGTDDMKFNVFDSETGNEEILSHDEMVAILEDARKHGSLRDAILEHGITNVEVLFPEARSVTNPPEMISRDMEWVSTVLGGVNKTPFSRVKSSTANITADEARAKGYVKGNKKIEEVIPVLKRSTTPQTVYKLQKMDRDDVIDITDFDVVAWIKAEMRVMLNEELGRAVLVGDGRNPDAEDKIKTDNIRPIYTDDELYSMHYVVDVEEDATNEEQAEAFIDAVIRARKDYKGSGAPVMFMGPAKLTECRLVRDKMGHRLYKTDQEVADEMRVSKIVEVELFDNITRVKDGIEYALDGIAVNLRDYTMGADKGGNISFFEDFDLDYNKHEYLIETRCSGALTKPKSAMVFETAIVESGESGESGE